MVRRPAKSNEPFNEHRARLLSGQPFATLDEAIAGAAPRQAELIRALEEAAAGHGNVKNPGVKTDRARMEQKIAEKYDGDVRQLTDVVRAGVTIDAPDKAEPIVAALGRRFRVIDEGWKLNEAGYFDRKLEVMLPDGAVAEIQLWPPEIYAAKKQGDEMYRARREAPPEAQEAMLERERAYWAAARAELDPVWAEAMGGSPNLASLRGNPARASASDSGSPSQPTSAELTSRQPSAPIENARPERSSMTASVEPQANQRTLSGSEAIGTSKSNMGASPETVKPSELTTAGEQRLLPGVEPVRELPADSLFGDAHLQKDLFANPALARDAQRVLTEAGGSSSPIVWPALVRLPTSSSLIRRRRDAELHLLFVRASHAHAQASLLHV